MWIGGTGESARLRLLGEMARARVYEGVFAPERESVGEDDMGVRYCGVVVLKSSLSFGRRGITIKEGFCC